jgi:hypothetical protein
MNFSPIGKIAGVLALTIGLAGCVDMTQDIKVTSTTTADLTVTTTMSADIYPMIKAGAAGEDAEPFCQEEGSTLTENADGSATCVMTSSGAFDDLKYDEDDSSSKPVFTANPDGTVRVAIETKGMLQQLFADRYLTLRFGGAEVVETNMDEVGDGYAEKKLPFLDLINGTIELPEELYAVVRP